MECVTSRCERGYHVFYFLITHVVDLHELCQLTDNIYGVEQFGKLCQRKWNV